MISENIQALRKKQNWTQETLAEKIGVSRQTVAKWESGESAPDLATAGRLSEVLDVSLDDLVSAPQEEFSEEELKGRHMFGLVTVGDRGQIVIPIRARRLFHIQPGDQLMVLGEEGKGLALTDARLFMAVMEEMRNDR